MNRPTTSPLPPDQLRVATEGVAAAMSVLRCHRDPQSAVLLRSLGDVQRTLRRLGEDRSDPVGPGPTPRRVGW